MRKGVSDLHRRAQVSQACNNRYAEHLAAAEISETLRQVTDDVCRPVRRWKHRFRALNPSDTKGTEDLHRNTRSFSR